MPTRPPPGASASPGSAEHAQAPGTLELDDYPRRGFRYSPPDVTEGKPNTTVITEDQIIVAAEITTKGGDFEELAPMITAAEHELTTAGFDASPGVVLADAGYWSNEHIDSLRERGLVPIVAADTNRTGHARPGSAGPMTSCAG